MFKLVEQLDNRHTVPMAKANDKQVGGKHYKGRAIEHWDIVAQHDLDYFQGQIIKYVMRWRHKNGLQDLLKAQHFLEKYIELNSPATPNDGTEPGPGYVDQDRRGPSVLGGQVVTPPVESSGYHCATCKKMYFGLADFVVHRCVPRVE